jgi:uncharacterized phage protein (predicted DNA packaging)
VDYSVRATSLENPERQRQVPTFHLRGWHLFTTGKIMLTLTETKMHLRVDGDDEDALINGLMDTATQAAADYLGLDLLQMTGPIPAPIRSAALLMVADLYQNREAQSERPLHANTAYERLLAPYRRLV